MPRLSLSALMLVLAAACGTSAAAAGTDDPLPFGGTTTTTTIGTTATTATTATIATVGSARLDALEALSGVALAPEHLGGPAYDRGSWVHWLDDDGDGCDTRREVLIAEAVVSPGISAACGLGNGGLWSSRYDGASTSDPSDFDVDHVVALAEAHRSGGWAWGAPMKAAFANDVSDDRTLRAVTSSSNRSKGDRDPAGWLPAEHVCDYIGDWIAVKARWQLAMDAEEATELSDLLVGPCAGWTIASWPLAPTPLAAVSTSPTTDVSSIDPFPE